MWDFSECVSVIVIVILSTCVAEHASLSCRKCGSRIHSGAVNVACIAGDFQACGRCAKQVEDREGGLLQLRRTQKILM